MWYGLRPVQSCRTILMFLTIEGLKWYNFILGANPPICETVMYEPAKKVRQEYSFGTENV
jgi:hypothetical protein